MCERFEVDPGTPGNDRMTLVVDAATAGPSGKLRELPRGERNPIFSVVLIEALNGDRTRGHIDAQRKCFGSEHELHEAALEELFDDGFELRSRPA